MDNIIFLKSARCLLSAVFGMTVLLSTPAIAQDAAAPNEAEMAEAKAWAAARFAKPNPAECAAARQKANFFSFKRNLDLGL